MPEMIGLSHKEEEAATDLPDHVSGSPDGESIARFSRAQEKILSFLRENYAGKPITTPVFITDELVQVVDDAESALNGQGALTESISSRLLMRKQFAEAIVKIGELHTFLASNPDRNADHKLFPHGRRSYEYVTETLTDIAKLLSFCQKALKDWETVAGGRISPDPAEKGRHSDYLAPHLELEPRPDAVKPMEAIALKSSVPRKRRLPWNWSSLAEKKYEDSGILDLELGSLRISMNYRLPASEERALISKVLGGPKATIKGGQDIMSAFRVVGDAVLADTASEKEPISLRSLLPGWKIIFSTDRRSKQGRTEGGFVAPSEKVILIHGGFDTAYDLITLLHEMGHATVHDRDSQSDSYRKSMARDQYDNGVAWGEQVDRQALEVLLRDERDAWAIALRVLRPVLKDKNGPIGKQDVLDYIHHVPLASYGRPMQKLIEKGLVDGLENNLNSIE